MSGFRAYFDFAQNAENFSAGDRFNLSQDESRHLCGSLRAEAGESVDVFDLSGKVYTCKIIEPSQKRCEVEIVENVPIGRQQVKVTLAQCLPKGKVFDEIIRQAVEVGTSAIVPIISDHSIFRTDAEDLQKKREKWLVKVVEAIKQSANFFEFKLPAPVSAKKFFEDADKFFDLKIVASLESGSRPILEVLEHCVRDGASPRNVCVLIGPEGDLSPKEYAQAAECGFKPVKLGDNVMKCETAALCALSVCRCFFDTNL